MSSTTPTTSNQVSAATRPPDTIGVSSSIDETTPLLRPPLSENDSEDEIARIKIDNVNPTAMFYEESKIIAWNALPIFGSQILDYSLVFVSVFTLGHLSTTALAAISVATMTANVTGLSMIQGFCSALDTLLPSAWTSDQPQQVGLWVQRMAILVAVEVVLILALWLNAEPVLLALKQEPEIARLAGLYLRWASLGLPAYACTTIMRRFFQAQELFSVPTKLIMIVAPFNLILNYTLVHGSLFPSILPFSGLGFIGAPISTATCQYLLLILNVTYAYFFCSRRAYHPPTILAFHHLGLVTKLGLSGIGQLAGEWWAWELVALAASWLGALPMAAQSILLTTEGMLFQVTVAISSSSNVRLGNLLGEGNSGRASVAMWSSLALSVVGSGAACLLLLIFRNSWGAMFVTDPAVIVLVSSILPTIAFFQILDGNASVTAAIMRVKGQQAIGALFTLSAYYLIGLPIGVWMAFKAPNGETQGWGLIGLWYGLTIALVYTSIAGTWFVLRTDWQEEVVKVQKRVKAEEEDRRRTMESSGVLGEGGDDV